MEETFAGRVRAAAKEIGDAGGEITSVTVGEMLKIQTFNEKKMVLNVLGDLAGRGELQRSGRGVYLVPRDRRVPLQKKEVMWRFLRAARVVTVDDLRMHADAKASYVKEWLRGYIKLGVIQDLGAGKYMLVKDDVTPPKVDDNARKLRKLREQVKVAKMEVEALRDSLVASAEVAQLACQVLQMVVASEEADAAIEATGGEVEG